jgi:Cof subfamily protein (haloacid dehalogenase superfamily)
LRGGPSNEEKSHGTVSVAAPSLLGAVAIMSIKLVIADVDGTLVTRRKALTARTCEAVARLRVAGIEFTITSGRPPRGMAALIAPLGLTAPVAAFNGAVYVKPDLTTVLAQHTLPSAVAHQAVDYLLGAGLDVWVYQGADWFITRSDAFRVARESSNVGFDPVVIDDLHAVLDAPIKIVGVSEDHARVARSEAELAERLGADASAARSQPYYLDITQPEANKGMVVREASRILRIPLEEIATIGDMPNDISMLSIAGLSIAMGNAGAEVQRVARHVTSSNEQEGFAEAVDSFILGEPPLARTALGLPPRARACIFGLDGVLTQPAELEVRAWKQLFDYYPDRRRCRAIGPLRLHRRRRPPGPRSRAQTPRRGHRGAGPGRPSRARCDRDQPATNLAPLACGPLRAHSRREGGP